VFLHNTPVPYIRVFRPERSNGSALLVIPGGAYVMVSIDNEGVQIAERFNPLGYTVFVLVYRLPSEGWHDRAEVPLKDAQRAMRVVRSQAARYGFNADTVSALGFSAGGHLAATLATEFDRKAYKPIDATDQLSARPSAVGLIYPVITMEGDLAHAMSRKMLLGDAPQEELVRRYSPQLHVSDSFPPAFVVHAADDKSVPFQNSEMIVAAIRKARRPVEAHFLQEGGHGFGVGYPGTTSSLWPTTFDLWLRRAIS
jgi:acetyl esterase/lipase